MSQNFTDVDPVDPGVQALVGDLYDYLTLIVGKPFILNNIMTMHVHNDSNDVITTTNEKLTENWTSGGATGTLETDWVGQAGGNWEQNANATQIQNFLDGGSGFSQKATGYSIWCYSQLVVTQILNLIAANYNNEPIKDNQAGDNATANTLSSIVSSEANLEEQPGQNLAKTEAGVVQSDANTQQTATSCIDSFLQVEGNFSSLLQQLYS